MNALTSVVAALEPSLARHAAREPGPGRFSTLVEDPDRLFVLEAVYEGYLMHYGTPRAFFGMDPDLRLLGGDALYALGLERLAERGDVAAVSELAESLWLATARALSEDGGPGARAAWPAGQVSEGSPSPGAPSARL